MYGSRIPLVWVTAPKYVLFLDLWLPDCDSNYLISGTISEQAQRRFTRKRRPAADFLFGSSIDRLPTRFQAAIGGVRHYYFSEDNLSPSGPRSGRRTCVATVPDLFCRTLRKNALDPFDHNWYTMVVKTQFPINSNKFFLSPGRDRESVQDRFSSRCGKEAS